MLQSTFSSVETRRSWVVARVALLIMGVAFGAPWITLVALKDIAAEVRGERSIPAFASALMWIGSGVGGILMGRIAERIGIRFTVIFGASMVALGLALSSFGPSLPLYIGHGLFMGLIGIGGINAPFYVYVSRWFDRRRGSALALISSGAYLAGALWPPVFARLIAFAGWRHAMRHRHRNAAGKNRCHLQREDQIGRPTQYRFRRARLVLFGVPRLLRRRGQNQHGRRHDQEQFACCVVELVAFCSDLGISAAHGAAMLSVLLGAAFFIRQLWGVISDRIGGLYTMLAGSACQAVGMAAFLLTQDEVGLFTVAALFGAGFSGLVPANILTSRELFPVEDAYWRMPTLLLCSGWGMATGGWLAGILYDHFGFYTPAFAAGLAANLLNFVFISTLALRRRIAIA
jgi:MFS family permease